MKNRINVSEKNEATAFPYWVIIEPMQNFLTNNQGLHNIANMSTGIWFSREAAQEYLDCNPHHYSKHAKVYCQSEHCSSDWVNAINNAKERKE